MPTNGITVEQIARGVRLTRMIAYPLSFIVLVGLTFYLHSKSCVDYNGLRFWIELFNGATWPGNTPWLLINCPTWPFAVVLALKVLLTIGAIVVLFTLPTEYFVRKKRQTMNAREMIYSHQEAALSAVKIALRNTPEQQAIALEAIRDAGADWEAAYQRIFGASDDALSQSLDNN